MALKKLFIDIETHYVKPFELQTKLVQDAFRSHNYDPNDPAPIEDQFKSKAGLLPEFGQIICICMGYENPNTGEWTKYTRYGLDEYQILTESLSIIYKFHKSGYSLVGFNSNSFDIPFIAVRSIIHGIQIKRPINNHGLKPWEVSNEDVMQDWKLGRWNAASLQSVSACLGIPSKSEEIGGSNLYELDIEHMPWEMLGIYCDEDVWVTYQIYKKLVNTIY